MGVVEAVYNSFEVGEGFIWRQKASVDEEVEQFAIFDVFEDEVELCEALEGVVDAHDISVVYELHHCDSRQSRDGLGTTLPVWWQGRWGS